MNTGALAMHLVLDKQRQQKDLPVYKRDPISIVHLIFSLFLKIFFLPPFPFSQVDFVLLFFCLGPKCQKTNSSSFIVASAIPL